MKTNLQKLLDTLYVFRALLSVTTVMIAFVLAICAAFAQFILQSVLLANGFCIGSLTTVALGIIAYLSLTWLMYIWGKPLREQANQ